MTPNDAHWMALALEHAALAEQAGEVPVGALVVLDDTCIGRGFNQPISSHDPTAHAEIQALRSACQHQGNYRLPGATLYVTLEPCLMCAGAIIHARIARLVFATPEPKTGAAGSLIDAFNLPHLNHRVAVDGLVLQAESRERLQAFFRARR